MPADWLPFNIPVTTLAVTRDGVVVYGGRRHPNLAARSERRRSRHSVLAVSGTAGLAQCTMLKQHFRQGQLLHALSGFVSPFSRLIHPVPQHAGLGVHHD